MNYYDFEQETKQFFQHNQRVLPLFEAFEEKLYERFPETSKRVQKTQITYFNSHVFACVSLIRVLRKSALPDPYLVITLGLPQPLNSERVAVQVEPYPGRWTVHIVIGSEAEIKTRIGYSTGTISWYPRKKIRAIKDVMKPFYDSWDDATYERYLRLFALDEDKAPLELSEGMKVKCNLLFALSHGAEALILDEPTSGLDPFSRDELLELFEQIRREGVAVFFSTHIISDIEKCADDIIYISKGRIVAACPKEEFADRYQEPGETLEEAFLRLERGAQDA